MLNRDTLLFSPTREGVPSSDDNFYASDILAGQEALEREARETLPFEFNECTFDLGYIRQPLYSCLTCLNHGAVCAACSIACHGEHELVELFNRRHFRCDCGTEKMGAGSCCTISHRDDFPINRENKYDQNFSGQFCFCGKSYDPHTETDSMYQCLVCEDWIHHKCLFGIASDSDEGDKDDEASATTSSRPPLSEDDFDMLVCERCVESNERVGAIAQRYAGRPGSGVMLIDRRGELLGATNELMQEKENNSGSLDGTDSEEGGEVEDDRDAEDEGTSKTEMKRKVQDDEDEDERTSRVTKKSKPNDHEGSSSSPSLSTLTSSTASTSTAPRPDSSLAFAGASNPSTSPSCSAPPPLPVDGTPLSKVKSEGGRVNLFLANDWQSIWCRCRECLPMFYDLPYFLEEEEEYTPPQDEQAHQSTFDLGMDHLLNKMPRAQALDSIRAFSGLSDRIKDYLRPLAEAGTSITKEHIESFFAEERERNSGSQLK